MSSMPPIGGADRGRSTNRYPGRPGEKPEETAMPKAPWLSPKPPAPAEAPARSPASSMPTPEEFGMPALGGLEPEPEMPSVEPADEVSQLETRVDPRTGLSYKVMPRVDSSPNQAPAVAVEDFDIHNLGSEADVYLGHLRVPLTAAEKLENEKRRRAMLARSLEKRREEDLALNKELGEQKTEEVIAPEGFFSRIFGRKKEKS